MIRSKIGSGSAASQHADNLNEENNMNGSNVNAKKLDRISPSPHDGYPGSFQFQVWF